MSHHQPESFHRMLNDVRHTLHEILNVLRPPRHVTPIVTFSGRGFSITFEGVSFMATVKKTGGPLKFDVSGFVDDAGNPVTDTDPATYTSSNEAVATVVNDPADAQDGIITLTGQTTPEGETVVITANFPAQRGGQAFSVVGNLIVIEPAAAGAQAVITGPGVVDGA
jgi:hypothetical protein